MKRVISLIIAVIMIIGTCPLAFASGGQAAVFTYPENGQWMDPAKDIVIKWNAPSSGQRYQLTINDDVSGDYIVNKQFVTSTSYTIPKYTLVDEQRYKLTLVTYNGSSVVGDESVIYFNTMDGVYPEPSISYPRDGDLLDASNDINLKFSQTESGLLYRLTILNMDNNKAVIRNKEVSKSGYTISAGTLDPDTNYKIWIGAFVPSYIEFSAGNGSFVCITTKEEVTRTYNTAKIVSPENGEEISTVNDLEIKWNSMDSELAYYLTVTDSTSGEVVKTYKTQENSSCKIDNNLLIDGHRYKAELTTYIPDPGDWTDKKLNGEIVGTSTCIFTAKAPVYAKITNLYAKQVDETIAISYEISEGEFYCLKLTLNDSNGDEYMESSNITKRSGTIEFSSSSGIDSDTYTVIAEMYRAKGHMTDEKTCTVTYKSPESKEEAVIVEYEAAQIYEPSDNKYFDSDESIKVRWNNSSNQAEYVISVSDESSGDYVVKNSKTANTYYTISEDSLLPDHRYKVSVKTTINGSQIGNESYIYININAEEEPVDYKAAEIQYPSNNDSFDYGENIKLKWNIPFSQSEFEISVQDERTGDYVLRDYKLTDHYYTINADELFEGHSYKISLKTYSNGNKVGNESIAYININASVPSISEGYTDVPENHINYDSIMFLSKEGVLLGYGNGYFKPEASITRAEFVKIVCEAFDLKLAGNYKNFNDTRTHWAREHIEIASSLGLVNGVDEYNFAPDDRVTYQQAAKVITILKGLDSRADLHSGYPTGYLVSAVYNGLFEKTKVIYNGAIQSDSFYDKNASRCDIAQIVYNALNHDGNDMTPIDLDYINSTNNKLAAILESTANNHIGNTYAYYGYDSNVSWCVYSALCIVRESLENYGCSDEEINEIIPYASYSEGSTGKMIFIYNNQGRYHSYTSWVNKNRKSSNGEYISGKGDFSMNINTSGLEYIPAPGDFIAVETANDGGLPDHLGLVISVDEENMKFVSVEGNTGSGTTSTRKVRWVDYEYSSSKGKWVRTSQYGGSNYYVHGFLSPNYPN